MNPDDDKTDGKMSRGAWISKRLSASFDSNSKRVAPLSATPARQQKEEPALEEGDSWKKNLTPEEIKRAEEWVRDNVALAEASAFLNAPKIIIFWILLLIADMVVLFIFMNQDNPPLWAQVSKDLCVFLGHHHVMIGTKPVCSSSPLASSFFLTRIAAAPMNTTLRNERTDGWTDGRTDDWACRCSGTS